MKDARRKTVVVGMSGGVDSSVAAWLLTERGYDVRGLFMENWEDDEEQTYCTAAEDFQDARQVAAELDIPLQKVNFAAEYRERVFRYFLREYEAGRTPNPDVLCNSEIKFRAFLDYALRLGADWIATGHYCRVRHAGDAGHLLKGRDPAKDQSYFLHGVESAALARTLFPLGDTEKTEVREMAVDAGFDNFDKKDSTGICFIGERPMREFLGKYLPARPGEIHTPDGRVIGHHDGLMYYTIGQRKGLRIGGVPGAPDEPWYVVDKDMANNRLIAAQGHDHPLLHHGALRATDLHWINGTPGTTPFRCRAKTRYRQRDQDCTITRLDEDHCIVEFDRTQRAVSPGQYVVFYEGDECLGGGIIDRALEGGADRPLAHTG